MLYVSHTHSQKLSLPPRCESEMMGKTPPFTPMVLMMTDRKPASMTPSWRAKKANIFRFMLSAFLLRLPPFYLSFLTFLVGSQFSATSFSANIFSSTKLVGHYGIFRWIKNKEWYWRLFLANNVFALLQTLFAKKRVKHTAESRMSGGVTFLVSCVVSFDVCVVLLVPLCYVNRSV